MPRAGSVEVPLTRHHCRALAWWLRERYVPFAAERWRAARTADHARDLHTAARLARLFYRLGARSLKNAEQDRDATRTIPRTDACWLGSQIDASLIGQAPCILPPFKDGQFPSPGALALLPEQLVRELLLGLGAYQSMARCYDRTYSRTVGKKRRSRTLAEVMTQNVGNPHNGGDERYERRLRARARKDEAAAAIAFEFELAMRALEARSRDGVVISGNYYPPA